MESPGMDVTMELHCTLAVFKPREGDIENDSMGSITVTRRNTNSTPPEKPTIIVHMSFNNTLTKYNLNGNILNIFTQSLNEGRASLCLKEPSCDIFISEADPNQLTTLIGYVKELLPAHPPLYFSMPHSEPLTDKIYLDCQEKYKLRMENIIRRNMDHVLDLNICNCTLELEGYQLPITDAIRKMKNLTSLRLEDIKLRSSTFLEIESKELKQLHLCYSKTRLQIASLFKNDLCYKDSLVELNLEGNNWPETPNGIFQFRNLLKLSLSDNFISQLPDMFTNLPKLQVLSLNYNQLKHLPPSIFVLQNLSELFLGANLISELPDMFTYLPKLEALMLCDNQLGCVPLSIFALQNLYELSLNNNRITYLPDTFDNLTKLKILSLARNQLKHLPPSIFALQNLLKLSLNGNLINDLPNKLPNLPKLETLVLSDNQLRYVPDIVFEMQNLSELSLSGNYITELSDKFTNLSKLKYLSLEKNQLKHLPPSIFSLHLQRLDIRSNPFNFEIPPTFDSELIVHSLKELSYRAILNHKLRVDEGKLPMKFLKDLHNYHQCICGCKFVNEGQDLLFICNLNDISRFTCDNRHLRVPIRGKMCTSLKICFLERFTKATVTWKQYFINYLPPIDFPDLQLAEYSRRHGYSGSEFD